MPNFATNKNIDALRIQCENASSPSEKQILCQEYEMAKQQPAEDRQAFVEGGKVKAKMKDKKKAVLNGKKAYAKRKGYEEGGMAFAEEPEFIEDEMEDFDAGETEEVEPSILDLAPEVLDDEDLDSLNDILDMHPDLPRIIDQLSMAEDDMEGMIEGPGTETSDSIPAKLSDGEFVFTAKAVKQIGVDKLTKMMKKAEEDFDMSTQESAGQTEFACGGFVHKR